MLDDDRLNQFVTLAFKSAFELINPSLTNYAEFTAKLAQRIKVKAGDNEQFEFDVALDRLFLEQIDTAGLNARVFSEESSWSGSENPDYVIVYDPLCNSSLASRTFLDAAVGMTFFTRDRLWAASVILDYQTGVMAVAQTSGVRYYQVQSGDELKFDRMSATTLDDAWVVLTLESRDERAHLREASGVLTWSKRVISNSGHIYWLRLAEGMIDAYADPFGGEELYEMFACMVAKQAGCIVTDVAGKEFDPSEMLTNFERDRHYRFYPVAARSPELHAELLAALRTAGDEPRS